MNTLDDWEAGRFRPPDDYYRPVFEREKSIVDLVIPNRILFFKGEKTKFTLPPEFAEILEPGA